MLRSETGRCKELNASRSKYENEAEWDVDEKLDWDLQLTEAVEVPDGTNVLVETFLRGPRPQTHQLVVAKPHDIYDLRRGVNPGTLLRCKVSNIRPNRLSVPKGAHVVRAFEINNFDLVNKRPSGRPPPRP